MKIRVALADDHQLVTQSLALILENQAPDIRVVGTASRADTIISLVAANSIDVVLMDIQMPGRDGLSATREIRRASPQTKVIMLTTYDDDEYLSQATAVGASGYLLKDIVTAELIASIRSVYAGVDKLSPVFVSRLVDGSPSDQEISNAMSSGLREILLYELTEQERRILKLLLRGFGNQEIADRVNLSYQTVKNNVSTIYTKLDVGNRREARQLVRGELDAFDS